MRIDPKAFQNLDLEVHNVLHDVPLQDVSFLDLPDAGDRTVSDIRSIVLSSDIMAVNPAVRFLTTLRTGLGQLFGWDTDDHQIDHHAEESYVNRLSPEIKERSLLPPGTSDLQANWQLLYLIDQEWVVEIRNATVHAWLAFVLIKTSEGHRFYWAIYVKPVSRFTPLYMGMIEPFRRFIVYPAILNRVRAVWAERYLIS